MSETGFAVLAEPPSRAETRDAIQLAEAVLSVYRQGVPVYARLAELDAASGVGIAFRSPASTARGAAAVLATLQLAVDAAAVAVEYVEETEYSGGEVDPFVLEALSGTPRFELEIVELTDGSIRGRLRLLATRGGRGKLLNVALIASVVLSRLITAIPSLVISVLIAANEVTPDEKDARIRALEEELSGLREEMREQLATNGELTRRIERLERISPGGVPSDVYTVFEVEIAA
ncbi:MAG TPA: hypothetical protein VHO26_10820 [Propionibacteriaceae bacterium]|nr:hypothetical protein [Propionibacteriaceae bacterium]